MNPEPRRAWINSRSLLFLGLLAAAAGFAWRDLGDLVSAALRYDQFTHVLIILPVTAAILYLEEGAIFRSIRYCPAAVAGLILSAAGFAYLPAVTGDRTNSHILTLPILCFVVWCISAFVLTYGAEAFRAARFPLLFLLLMVPIPGAVLDRTVSMLQNSSADVTFWLLRIAQVPVFRRGFILSLPGIDIEVASECSGIRSSLMLFIVSLVLGHLFLRSNWKKILLCVAVFPITIFKNALRIFTLSTLSVYVDPSFLSGRLHEYGGIPFFALALGSLILVLWMLHRSEKKTEKGNLQSRPSGKPVLLSGLG